MDARTKKRMAVMQDVAAMLRTQDTFREWLECGSPIVVALPDDSVGEILGHIRKRRNESPDTDHVRVVMRMPRAPFQKTRSLRFSCIEARRNLEPPSDPNDPSILPVSVDSEWSMLVTYLDQHGGEEVFLKALASTLGLQLTGSVS